MLLRLLGAADHDHDSKWYKYVISHCQLVVCLVLSVSNQGKFQEVAEDLKKTEMECMERDMARAEKTSIIDN